MKNFRFYLDKIGEIGEVSQITPSIAWVEGLPGLKPAEMVILETGQMGQVFHLLEEAAEILLFSEEPVRPGTKVARTGEVVKVPVGEEVLGLAVNPLGEPLLVGSFSSRPRIWRSVESEPEGIEKRLGVHEPLPTGVTIVDLLVPLAKGQRELVVGDRKTGKTAFLLQTIVSAVKQGVVCLYAAVGKKQAEVKKILDFFAEKKVLPKMSVVAVGPQSSPGLIFLAPYTAMTMAEYFKEKGKDVLLVLDDLTLHAKFCRQLALQAKRFPGRDSYPVDIFFTHARLLERGGNFRLENGQEASLTVLPVAETISSDLSGYIPTNLMSMTDGHIFFDAELFAKGRRPAVNNFLSVTRVGQQAQTNVRRQLSRELSSFLANFEKLQSYIHFGAELTEATQKTLAMGEKIAVFLNQEAQQTIPVNVQVFFLAFLWQGKYDNLSPVQIKSELGKIAEYYLTDKKFKDKVDKLIAESKDFNQLLKKAGRIKC